MTVSKKYKMSSINDFLENSGQLSLIFSPNKESRSFSTIQRLITNRITVDKLIIIDYGDSDIDYETINKLHANNTRIVQVNKDPMIFLYYLKEALPATEEYTNLFLDITCIRTPEMFILLKYLKAGVKQERINVSYTIPYDYKFEKEPFTSYRSYYGDLSMFELLGYGGSNNTDLNDNDLYLFMGFEGSLSLKVMENCAYKKLMLINNLPAFYPKYKDISVLNNYQVMSNQHYPLYVPADNPFEVVNLLCDSIHPDEQVCIAPLSTKPVSLGVCLYALNNDKVRVVYPISSKYNQARTLDSYETYGYEIWL